MNDQNNTPDVQTLGGLLNDSGVSRASQSIIIDNLNANQAALLGTTGVGADFLNEDDVTVLTMVLDMSSSMSRFTNDVIDGFNQMLQALRDSKLDDSVIMSLWTFNHKPNLVHNYKPLADVQDLDNQSYSPYGTTALYDTVLNAMTGQIAYVTDLANNGITARGVVVVISDGEDNESTRATAAKIKTVSDDMLNQEIYTLAFFAFGFHGEPIAQSMGFPSIMQTGMTQSELRRAMDTVSKSIIRASQAQINASGGSFFS